MEESTQQDERRIAEDFRRQLQERSLRGYVHPSTAERLRWLDQNSELLKQIARVSWGSTPGTGLTPDQKVWPVANVIWPLLAMDNPVAVGVLLPDPNSRLRLADGVVPSAFTARQRNV